MSNKYFSIAMMPIVFPLIEHGTWSYPEDVMQDKEGLQTMRNIGKIYMDVARIACANNTIFHNLNLDARPNQFHSLNKPKILCTDNYYAGILYDEIISRHSRIHLRSSLPTASNSCSAPKRRQAVKWARPDLFSLIHLEAKVPS